MTARPSGPRRPRLIALSGLVSQRPTHLSMDWTVCAPPSSVASLEGPRVESSHRRVDSVGWGDPSFEPKSKAIGGPCSPGVRPITKRRRRDEQDIGGRGVCMKMLRLVGGTGWVSTLEYYRLINEGVNRRRSLIVLSTRRRDNGSARRSCAVFPSNSALFDAGSVVSSLRTARARLAPRAATRWGSSASSGESAHRGTGQWPASGPVAPASSGSSLFPRRTTSRRHAAPSSPSTTHSSRLADERPTLSGQQTVES